MREGGIYNEFVFAGIYLSGTSCCAENAYSKFDGDDPAPIVKIDKKLFMLELWHGPTMAFKDMALTVLPHLLNLSKKKLGVKEKTLILVATSGDTGKAALEGFKDVEGVKICVFYRLKAFPICRTCR